MICSTFDWFVAAESKGVYEGVMFDVSGLETCEGVEAGAVWVAAFFMLSFLISVSGCTGFELAARSRKEPSPFKSQYKLISG